MKKLVLTTIIALFAVSAFAGDMLIQPNQLPQNAQKFIADTFKNAKIVAAQRDTDSFEAVLSTGAKVKFNLNGEWDEIEAYAALPSGLLPAAVEKAAKSQGGQIIQIDKDFGYFDVKFSTPDKFKITFGHEVSKSFPYFSKFSRDSFNVQCNT